MSDRDEGQARAFLERINAERDSELEEIESRFREQRRELRSAAYRRSIERHREQVEQARGRQGHRHDRRVSRATAAVRRQSWALAGEWREAATQQLLARVRDAWQDPASQWQWCRYWAERALSLAGAGTIELRLGEGTLDATAARLEAEYAGRLAVTRDPRLSAGLVACFGERVLDARLSAQLSQAENFIAGVLDQWMRADSESSDV